MIEEVFKYKEIVESIAQEIKKSPFKVEYVIKESKIIPGTFYRKLKNNTFTPDEIIRILYVIKPKEAHEFKFQLLLKKSLKNVKEGNTISNDEMKKRINEKYGFDIS